MNIYKKVKNVYMKKKANGEKPQWKQFAITLMLHPTYTSLHSYEEQYLEAEKILIALQNNGFASVYTTFEITKKFDIHIHGILYYNDSWTLKFVQMHLDTLLEGSIIGFRKVKPIEDLYGWLLYINKNEFHIESHHYAFIENITEK